MAEKEESKSETTKAESDPTYETERLIEEAPAFLGVERHVAAGALHGAKKNLTVDEAEAAVHKWLSKAAD